MTRSITRTTAAALASSIALLAVILFFFHHETINGIQSEQLDPRRRLQTTVTTLTTPSPINILSLGGSVTWGSGLERREQAYPSLLLQQQQEGQSHVVIHRSDNLAIRASSAVWPSTCVQTMIRDAASGEDVEYDIVLLEFSLNGLMGLQLLVHRLRRRYPHALIVYIDLYSNRKPGYSNCIGPTCRVTLPRHRALLELVQQKVGGVVLELPRPQDPVRYQTSDPEIASWFASDDHHLNANGHAWIAQHVMELIHSHRHQSATTTAVSSSEGTTGTGSWLEGDLCLSWFHTGRVPPGISVEGASLNEFAPSKWAFEVSSHATLDLMMSQQNQLFGPAPLVMVYMTKQDLYSPVEVTLNNSPAFELDSKSSNDKFFQDHVTETKLLGTIHPQDSVIHLEIVSNTQVHHHNSWPFRLVGLTMCAACKTFDAKFEEKSCRQRACVDFVEE